MGEADQGCRCYYAIGVRHVVPAWARMPRRGPTKICRRGVPQGQHSRSVNHMSTFPQLAWVEAFRDHVNADPEMRLIGQWFTTSLSLAFGDTRYVLRVEQGCIGDIAAQPRIDARAAFGFRAPIEVWRKFLSAKPPPLYHDFFAMLMRVPEFVIEGDSLIAMQNARALHRMMNLMRDTEAGNG